MAQVAHVAPRDKRVDRSSSNNGASGRVLASKDAGDSSGAHNNAPQQQQQIPQLPYQVRVPNARSEYPLNVSVDFTQLRTHALRRYMAFHRLDEPPGSSREQLAVAVAHHFNTECQHTDERTSITSFIAYLTKAREAHATAAAATATTTLPAAATNASNSDTSDSEPERERDSAFDYYPHEREEEPDDDDDDANPNARSGIRKRKASPPSTSSSSSSSSPTDASASATSTSQSVATKKKRKARVYCVCKGASFGNMIACDSKTCMDRSNWYHMSCVGLADCDDPPDTWYCPTCAAMDDPIDLPENQYRKPVASVTYGDMISHALAVLPHGKGSFKEICDFVETEYESQLNWKLESDQRKSPVWKSSVRKILFSNMRFRKHPADKGLFCLAA